MSVNHFRKRLLQEVLIFDGAMGTWLCEQGVSHTHPFEELNLSQPHLVARAHRLYIAAGANVIETNSFSANYFKLARHGLEDKVYDINLKAAELARDIAGDKVFVAGSIGPLGVLLAPLGTVSREEVVERLQGQLQGLLDGGVDLILLETQANIEQAELLTAAVTAKLAECRPVRPDSADGLTVVPVVCSFSFGPDMTTSDGCGPEDAVARVAAYPISAVGVNCALGPDGTVEAVRRMRRVTDLPIIAQPNAGLPATSDGRTLFMSTPDYFARKAIEMLDAGANALGGCCGTRPDHIAAVSRAVSGRRPERVAAGAAQIPAPAHEPPGRAEERIPLLEKLEKDFLSLEVNPPRDVDYEQIVARIGSLAEIGLTAVNVTDNPMARVRMNSTAFAHLLKETLGLPVILHFTCRDRNLLGLQSELLGAAGLGIDGVLALTGDPASVGDYPQATSVFDVTSEGLVKIISNLNQGTDYAGKRIGEPTKFAIGVAWNPLSDNPDKELGRLRKKREMGAHYVITQPVYDLEAVRDLIKAVREELGMPVVCGLLPLTSSRQAEYLHNEVPGIKIPEAIRAALSRGDAASQKATGLAIAAEIYASIREICAGACLMLPGQDYEVARGIVAAMTRT